MMQEVVKISSNFKSCKTALLSWPSALSPVRQFFGVNIIEVGHPMKGSNDLCVPTQIREEVCPWLWYEGCPKYWHELERVPNSHHNFKKKASVQETLSFSSTTIIIPHFQIQTRYGASSRISFLHYVNAWPLRATVIYRRWQILLYSREHWPLILCLCPINWLLFSCRRECAYPFLISINLFENCS